MVSDARLVLGFEYEGGRGNGKNPKLFIVWMTWPLEGTPAASLDFLHKHFYFFSVFSSVEGGYLNVLSLVSMIIMKIQYVQIFCTL